MAHIFISYSHTDRDYVQLLAEDLRQHGFDVWMDEQIDYGDRWFQSIVQAVRGCGAFIVVMTPDAEKSEWVEKEVLLAQDENKVIFPLLRLGKRFPMLITTQYADVQDGSMPPENFYDRLGRVVTRKAQPGKIVSAPSGATAPAPAPVQPAAPTVPTLVVNRLGRGDCRTIGEAIQKAQPGALIRVQPGIYTEGLILDRPLEIVGDGPAEQIVVESTDADCVLMQTDYAVVRGLALRCRAGRKAKKYFGVDIPQGQLVLEDCDIVSDSLACIAIHGDTADPLIRRCRIHSENSGQGGVFIFENGAGTLEDCDIFDNNTAGLEIKSGGSPTVRNCKVRDGRQGGVYVHDDGAGTLEGCTISGNLTTNVQVKTGGRPVLRRCQIHAGQQGGVFISENGAGTFEDCDIFDNAKGGVMISAGSDPAIRRCQIHHGKQGGVFVYENGLGTLERCDIYENALAGVETIEGGSPVLRHCNINRNTYEGVYVHNKGQGTVEDCDLTGNGGKGAWDIEPGCVVQRSGNKE